MSKKPVTAVVVGGGHRAAVYANTALEKPEDLKITGIADPNPERVQRFRELYDIPEENCFASAGELAERGRIADAVINGTMDHQHFETSAPLLELGYDMLLEKPFAVCEEEMNRLTAIVKKHGNKVMICHVLRYAPFYYTIKERLQAGGIGEVINIQMAENVSYHHMSTAYVRGKWNNSDICRTSMLLAKSCHDMDLMMWLMGRTAPAAVSSFGSLLQFRPENAPANAAEYCMNGCPLVDECLYSAKRIYLDHPDRWSCYVWSALEGLENPTLEDKANLLKSGSLYGRCIYKCGNNVVDHQSVLVNFASGATGTFSMTGGSAASDRTIHIIGTKGEISGSFENGIYTVKTINPEPGKSYDEETVNIAGADGHGGGDAGLTFDFIRYVRGEETSIACTSVFDSIAGHRAVFLADKSRKNNGKVYYFT